MSFQDRAQSEAIWDAFSLAEGASAGAAADGLETITSSGMSGPLGLLILSATRWAAFHAARLVRSPACRARESMNVSL